VVGATVVTSSYSRRVVLSVSASKCFVLRILHIIIGLDTGGAEHMLKRLIESHGDNTDYVHSVISITKIGKVGEQLKTLGVEVQALGMRNFLDAPHVLWKLSRLIRAINPEIVQTWMYHADLFGGLAARLVGKRNVIWGIRGSAIPQKGLSATRMVVTLCSWTSHFLPSVIICCAEAALVAHVNRGYDQSKMIFIPNGYDLSRLHRNAKVRSKIRSELGVDDCLVVGIVGRFDPLKDYRNFVIAASMLASRVDHVKFLMIGRDVVSTNLELNKWIAEGNYAHKYVLAGERDDIPGCLAAMDVFCLSSCQEGFPNVVCEAMAMNVPCVVTDVGDAAEIVSDTGIVVPSKDSTALAEALQAMIRMGVAKREYLGNLARLRIEENYSIETASARFELIYNQLIEKKPQ
jgi:glycosyltransferase involved in cell wall biosynthesis